MKLTTGSGTTLTPSTVSQTNSSGSTVETQTISGIAAQTTYTVTVQFTTANGSPVTNGKGITADVSVNSGGARYDASTVSSITVHSNGTGTFTYTTGTPGTSNGTTNNPSATVQDTVTIVTNPPANYTSGGPDNQLTTNAF